MSSNKWISVKDRLPKSGVATGILFFFEDGIYNLMLSGHFNLDRAEFKSHMITVKLKDVTHWQPLPDPPKTSLSSSR